MINKILILLIIGLLATSSMLEAVEEEYEDVVASVVVGSTFKMSIDNDYLSFVNIKPGERLELYSDRNYNQVTAISNHNKPWYLKMSVMGEGLQGPGHNVIPADKLLWKVDDFDGKGVEVEGWQSFQTEPVLVYSSAGDDARGEEVYIRLKYALDAPKDVVAGSYHTTISYTMTETP